MKKLILLAAELFSIGTLVYADVDPAEDEDSVEEITEAQQKAGLFAAATAIREKAGECLVVCCFEVKLQPHGIQMLADRGEMEYLIRATVTNAIQGKTEKGQIIEFRRYGGELKESEEYAKTLPGRLFFLLREAEPGGKFYVSPQDPTVFIPHTNDREKIWRDYFRRK